MNIPFIDLKIQYQNLKKEIDSAIKLVIDNTAFVRGKHVKDFENNFSSMFNTPVHTVVLMEQMQFTLLSELLV